MRSPSDAQAALLALVADHDDRGLDLEWQVPPYAKVDERERPSRARIWLEVIDREKNTSRFDDACGWRETPRVATVEACIRNGWLSTLHRRDVTFRYRRHGRAAVEFTRHLRQLDLTEDGRIVLGRWRERRLNAGPAPLPELSAHEREVVALAQRAHDLGYALCARKPARLEARRMRRAGWFTTCWVANQASGLVPTPMAVVEVAPERADHVATSDPSED